MRLCLYNLEQVAVLVLDANGPEYFYQAGEGGQTPVCACGYLVPVSNDAPSDSPELALIPRLHAAFAQPNNGLKWADEVDHLLMELSSSDVIRVDRQRCQDSMAGWVWVSVNPSGDYSSFGGGLPVDGVLVWPTGEQAV